MSKMGAHDPRASGSAYRLGYRPEIEGLRAIAVLLVVAAHAGVPGLEGGFVGVDIFFVLSGYLITGLLVQEVHVTGTVALARFYTKRLLRLMPALVLMIGVTGLLAWRLLPAAEQSPQAIAAASAALWLSNLHFALQGMDYFSPGSEANLFLHTWSLGVEEQFYLAWPVLVILALNGWRAKSGPHTPTLVRTLWLLMSASFALALYWSYIAPPLAFYMMPTRAWQFALGALVFVRFGTLSFNSSEKAGRNSAARTTASWLGLGMIAAAALLLDKNSRYPGAWALLPSIGTALILIPVRNASPLSASYYLSLRTMQAIGRVSYSWYLWHWPVLLLGATVGATRGTWSRLALVLLSLGIAAASWRYIEDPVRRLGRRLDRHGMILFTSLAVMVLAGSVAIRWGTNADIRAQSTEHLYFQAARTDAPKIYAMGCDDWYQSSDVKICRFGNTDAPRTAIALGDSIGLQWFPAYANVFASPDWQLLVITKSACPMVDVPIFYPRIGRMYTECAEWRSSALATVAALSPDILIMGSTHTYEYTSTQWEEGTRRVLERVAPTSERIFVMRSTPSLPFDGPSCLEPRSRLHESLSGGNHCTTPAESPRGQDVFRALQKAVAPFPNASILDMTEDVCPGGSCNAQLAGNAVFRDTQHLTSTFAESLSGKLGLLVFPENSVGDEDPSQ